MYAFCIGYVEMEDQGDHTFYEGFLRKFCLLHVFNTERSLAANKWNWTFYQRSTQLFGQTLDIAIHCEVTQMQK